MKTVVIIPARWQSTRLKGKVLIDLNGKPMIQHVWENARESRAIDDVIVAVDKEKVKKVVESFGGKAILTSPDHPSGTDRLAEVARQVDADIFINVQADEPLVHPSMIDGLAQVFQYEKDVQMATLIKRVQNKDEVKDPNVVKVVVDRKGFALYFSRSPIPYIRDGIIEPEMGSDGEKEQEISSRYFKHMGLYSYTKDFLLTYADLPKSTLEEDEKLEQLRVLEHGYKIRTLETRYDTIGVDTQEDVDKVKEILLERLDRRKR